MEIRYAVLLPEIILALGGILIMLLAPGWPKARQRSLSWLALVVVGMAMLATLFHWNASGDGFFGMVFQDNFANLSKILFLFSSGTVVVVSNSYLKRENLRSSDFLSLLLFATVGMCLMVASADLLMTFLGIEILSIASYILAGYRDADEPAESSWKYFLLGAFSTAFLLYGIAFLYGATGTTRFSGIASSIGTDGVSSLVLLGAGLLMVGFGFKAALVPFHVWTPDVYQGAPVPITSFLAVASKAAAFLALLRILLQVLPDLGHHLQMMFWLSAVLTMALGNIAALSQINIKRMLAYSSIAHAGYLLVGLTAGNSIGTDAVFFYLTSYAFMTLGAFAVIQVLAQQAEQNVQLNDYKGLGQRNPFLAISLAIFLFSMAGIPSTAGFLGKLFLFSAAIKSQLYWLVVLGLLATVAGVYYYLRVVVLMFMHEAATESPGINLPTPIRVTIWVMVLGTLGIGLFPGPLMEVIREATNF